ncbi:response regulator [Fulvivirgaceae bacterium BMA10]|uniref:Response regulator n=1 Tax=Splendidivirga corallicola TaxID=3051826 RepID=A0ABT8KHI8_9BACT|nr:response regulator [Fulvivirgaceae bacterium BMA10]
MAKLTIHIFTEDANLRENMVQQLNKEKGHKLVLYQNRTALMDSIDQKPDVIICDCSLSSKTAQEMLRSVRSSAPEVHIIFLGAKENDQKILELLNHGTFDHVIIQPDAISKIQRVITTISNFKDETNKNN